MSLTNCGLPGFDRVVKSHVGNGSSKRWREMAEYEKMMMREEGVPIPPAADHIGYMHKSGNPNMAGDMSREYHLGDGYIWPICELHDGDDGFPPKVIWTPWSNLCSVWKCFGPKPSEKDLKSAATNEGRTMFLRLPDRQWAIYGNWGSIEDYVEHYKRGDLND